MKYHVSPSATDAKAMSALDKWAGDVVKIPGLAMTKDEFISVFQGGIKVGQFGDPQNIIDNYEQFGNAFNQVMSNVWIGKETALTGLQAVKHQWEGIIQAMSKT